MEALDLTTTNPLSLQNLLVHLAIGLVLAVMLSLHFRKFGSTLANRREFAGVFPLIVLTTILIITVVKSSLALALGLVGALSIVRFRTPIKEPEELAYLFLAIAIGLGLGADQTLPTVAATLAILVAVAGVKGIARGQRRRNLYLSLDWHDGALPADILGRVEQILSQHADEAELRRCDARAGEMEATYLVDVAATADLTALVSGLREAFPALGVTFLDQSPKPGE